MPIAIVEHPADPMVLIDEAFDAGKEDGKRLVRSQIPVILTSLKVGWEIVRMRNPAMTNDEFIAYIFTQIDYSIEVANDLYQSKAALERELTRVKAA